MPSGSYRDHNDDGALKGIFRECAPAYGKSMRYSSLTVGIFQATRSERPPSRYDGWQRALAAFAGHQGCQAQYIAGHNGWSPVKKFRIPGVANRQYHKTISDTGDWRIYTSFPAAEAETRSQQNATLKVYDYINTIRQPADRRLPPG